jgi:hypothetical protein
MEMSFLLLLGFFWGDGKDRDLLGSPGCPWTYNLPVSELRLPCCGLKACTTTLNWNVPLYLAHFFSQKFFNQGLLIANIFSFWLSNFFQSKSGEAALFGNSKYKVDVCIYMYTYICLCVYINIYTYTSYVSKIKT